MIMAHTRGGVFEKWTLRLASALIACVCRCPNVVIRSTGVGRPCRSPDAKHGCRWRRATTKND